MIRFHFITWTLCLFSLSACGSLFKPAAPQAAVPAKFAAAAVQAMVLNRVTYIHTLLCGTRSLTAMESRAIAGGLSADHQLPGVPKAK